MIQADFPDEHAVACNFSIAWPAMSPDLNTSYLTQWGFPEDRVHQERVTNEADMHALYVTSPSFLLICCLKPLISNGALSTNC